jgi:hypothetical protein
MPRLSKQVVKERLTWAAGIYGRNEPHDLMLKGYYDVFNNVPDHLFCRAIMEAVKDVPRFPTPADISKHVDWAAIKAASEKEANKPANRSIFADDDPNEYASDDERQDQIRRLNEAMGQLGIDMAMPASSSSEPDAYAERRAELKRQAEMLMSPDGDGIPF